MGFDSSNVEIFRLSGSLFFGAVSKMEALLDPKRVVKKWTILDLSNLLNIDTTGLDAIEHLYVMLAKRGSTLLLVGASEQPLSLIKRSGLATKIGSENILDHITQASGRIGDSQNIS